MRDELPSVQLVIVSWSNQHQNAVAIADAVRSAVQQVSIVYSDADPTFEIQSYAQLIRRPNHLFFGDKFQACLEAYNGADLLLVVHADCTCSDWAAVVHACRSAMNMDRRIAVWAPHIHYTGFGLERTRLGDLKGTHLSMVAHTDSIVFAMSPMVIKRMQAANYLANVYGWGVGWLAVACAYANQSYAVVDRSVRVHYPMPRGYSSADAASQRDAFLQQMLPAERIQYLLLRSHMRLLDVHIARHQQAAPPEARPKA
jgi:hypothetical protein